MKGGGREASRCDDGPPGGSEYPLQDGDDAQNPDGQSRYIQSGSGPQNISSSWSGRTNLSSSSGLDSNASLVPFGDGSCSWNGKDEPSFPKFDHFFSADNAEGKARWSEFYIQCLEEALEKYVVSLRLCQKENSELRSERLKLQQQLERVHRRLGTTPKTSPVGGDNVGDSRYMAGGRSGARRLSEKPGAAKSGARTPLSKASVVNEASKNAIDVLPRKLVDTDIKVGEDHVPLEDQSEVLTSFLKKHAETLSAWTLAPDAPAGRPSPGKTDSEPSIHWYVEKLPLRADLARRRRSQGSSSRADVTALLKAETTNLDEMNRILQRGLAEEKRIIRWDLQSKRERTKRPDSESNECSFDDGEVSVDGGGGDDEGAVSLVSVTGKKSVNSAESAKRPAKMTKSAVARGSQTKADSESAPLDNFVFLFGPAVE